MISHWHIVISGFLQKQGAPNGMLRLATELHKELAGPETMVELRLWNESMAGLSEKIWLLRPKKSPRVRIYGYSWGGAAAMKLAAELRQRLIPVETMVLADPVYRHGYWLGNWRAFMPCSTLRVPPNVRRVYWYRQTMNWPRGHQPVAIDPDRTTISNGALVDATHQYMDDAGVFQRKAMEVARG